MRMAMKNWMSWEGGVDLIAKTSAEIEMPNVIVHVARMVHTPVGSAPGGMLFWQPDPAAAPLAFHEATVQLAVVGAHLEGQPLNWQLLERGARKLQTTQTSAQYKLVALPDTTPPKPGLARIATGGTAIEIEIWEMPVRRFGEFVAEVPAPLAIGSSVPV